MFAIVLSLVVCVAFAARIPRAEDPRIVGGRPAAVGEFPYQVSLRDSRQGSHFCGASIISEIWILTAAHCVPKLRPNDVIVVVGTNYLDSGGKSYQVAQIISHGSYDPQNHVNDIALLKISGQILKSPGVATVGLADSTTPPGLDMVVSGWGLTSYPSNSLPNGLQAVHLRSISIAQCQQLMAGFSIYSTNICTYVGPGQGTCQGDSGGPLVLNGTQHGIVSWGIPCAKGRPDVFSSVSAYRTWIKQISGI